MRGGAMRGGAMRGSIPRHAIPNRTAPLHPKIRLPPSRESRISNKSAAMAQPLIYYIAFYSSTSYNFPYFSFKYFT